MTNPPTEIQVLHAELELLAGGLHTLSDAVAHRGDADLEAQCRLLARQVEAVVERCEEIGRAQTKGR